MKLYISVLFTILFINSSYSQVSSEISLTASQSQVLISKKGETFQLTDQDGKIVISDIDSLYQKKKSDFIFIKKKDYGVLFLIMVRY